MTNSVDIMEKGFACLVKNLGVYNAECFISLIKNDKFDYTAWQREYFDEMASGEIGKQAFEYADKHPYTGNGEII